MKAFVSIGVDLISISANVLIKKKAKVVPIEHIYHNMCLCMVDRKSTSYIV